MTNLNFDSKIVKDNLDAIKDFFDARTQGKAATLTINGVKILSCDGTQGIDENCQREDDSFFSFGEKGYDVERLEIDFNDLELALLVFSPSEFESLKFRGATLSRLKTSKNNFVTICTIPDRPKLQTHFYFCNKDGYPQIGGDFITDCHQYTLKLSCKKYKNYKYDIQEDFHHDFLVEFKEYLLKKADEAIYEVCNLKSPLWV